MKILLRLARTRVASERLDGKAECDLALGTTYGSLCGLLCLRTEQRLQCLVLTRQRQTWVGVAVSRALQSAKAYEYDIYTAPIDSYLRTSAWVRDRCSDETWISKLLSGLATRMSVTFPKQLCDLLNHVRGSGLGCHRRVWYFGHVDDFHVVVQFSAVFSEERNIHFYAGRFVEKRPCSHRQPQAALPGVRPQTHWFGKTGFFRKVRFKY